MKTTVCARRSRLREIVGGHHESAPRAASSAGSAPARWRRAGSTLAGGFVQQQAVGVQRVRPGDREPLLLAPGQAAAGRCAAYSSPTSAIARHARSRRCRRRHAEYRERVLDVACAEVAASPHAGRRIRIEARGPRDPRRIPHDARGKRISPWIAAAAWSCPRRWGEHDGSPADRDRQVDPLQDGESALDTRTPGAIRVRPAGQREVRGLQRFSRSDARCRHGFPVHNR